MTDSYGVRYAKEMQRIGGEIAADTEGEEPFDYDTSGSFEEDLDQLIDSVVAGKEPLEELRRWKRKTAGEKRREALQRKKRKFKKKDPKRSRIAKKVRKKFLRNKSAARMASRRASISR